MLLIDRGAGADSAGCSQEQRLRLVEVLEVGQRIYARG